MVSWVVDELDLDTQYHKTPNKHKFYNSLFS